MGTMSEEHEPSQELAPNTKMEGVLEKSRANSMQIVAGVIKPETFAECVLYADYMAKSQIAVPKHLRGNPGACLAVVMQAGGWGMNAYNVAQKSYMVGSQIAYEAQVLAAVILSSGIFKQRPDYAYEGHGDKRICTVHALLADGSTMSHSSPEFGKIEPKNSPLWKHDPDQQQGYYTIRAMARLRFPDLLLGVYDLEEARYMEERNEPKVINPAENPLNDAEDAPTIDAKPTEPHEPGMPSDVEP